MFTFMKTAKYIKSLEMTVDLAREENTTLRKELQASRNEVKRLEQKPVYTEVAKDFQSDALLAAVMKEATDSLSDLLADEILIAVRSSLRRAHRGQAIAGCVGYDTQTQVYMVELRIPKMADTFYVHKGLYDYAVEQRNRAVTEGEKT